MTERKFRAVTGRFQPFHNDHLALALDALSYGALIIGITNPDPRSRVAIDTSAHRHLNDANPFSFFDRLSMIAAALTEAGAEADRYRIVPFPLDAPSVWPHYIPLDVVQIVRCYSDWEHDKAERLRAGGYRVEVRSGDPAARISATTIRERLRNGEPWNQWVPAAVSRYLTDTAIGHGTR